MKKIPTNKIVEIRTIVISVFICLVLGGFFYSQLTTKTFGSDENKLIETSIVKEWDVPIAKYSAFPHNKHKQSCNSCHKFPSSNWTKVRNADEAFPDITEYPKHESCLNCHRRQFYGTPKPVICTICHTNPGPGRGARHPFPNPRERFDKTAKGKRAVSDFAISFPHETHNEIVSKNKNSFEGKRDIKGLFVKVGMKRASEESCAVCHQTYEPQGDSEVEYVTPTPKDLGDNFWLKKGTFKTVPIGHTNCFTCHSKETGILPEPSNCAACHKLKPKAITTDFNARVAARMKINDKIMLDSWRRRDSSATFRHEWMSHAELDCAYCHNVSAINTRDPATKKVNILSCAICHITETSDDGGILNYEVDSRKKDAKFECVKCHISFGKSAIPTSHIEAIAAQAGN